MGPVARKGQADFSPADDVVHVATVILAVKAAKVLVHPTGRISLVDIDRKDWSELPS